MSVTATETAEQKAYAAYRRWAASERPAAQDTEDAPAEDDYNADTIAWRDR